MSRENRWWPHSAIMKSDMTVAKVRLLLKELFEDGPKRSEFYSVCFQLCRSDPDWVFLDLRDRGTRGSWDDAFCCTYFTGTDYAHLTSKSRSCDAKQLREEARDKLADLVDQTRTQVVPL